MIISSVQSQAYNGMQRNQKVSFSGRQTKDTQKAAANSNPVDDFDKQYFKAGICIPSVVLLPALGLLATMKLAGCNDGQNSYHSRPVVEEGEVLIDTNNDGTPELIVTEASKKITFDVVNGTKTTEDLKTHIVKIEDISQADSEEATEENVEASH